MPVGPSVVSWQLSALAHPGFSCHSHAEAVKLKLWYWANDDSARQMTEPSWDFDPYFGTFSSRSVEALVQSCKPTAHNHCITLVFKLDPCDRWD